VWRKLKSAGAVFLHQSAFLLASGKEAKALFVELEKEVIQHGGQARVLAVKIEDPKQQAEIVAQFNAESDEEYREFIERCDDLHSELKKERGKNHYSFAELEENDAEVRKLKSWLSRIQARDAFSAPLGPEAVAAFAEAERDYSRYEYDVTSREVAPEKRRKRKIARIARHEGPGWDSFCSRP
jgi:chromosome segregation ATPase